MIVALSSLALEREASSPIEMVERAAALGYGGFELNIGTPLVPLLGLGRRSLSALRKAVEACGFERFGAHAPATDLNAISVNEAVRALTFDQYLQAAALAREIGATTLTVHLGVGGWPGFPKEMGFQLCVDFFQRLCDAIGDGGPVLGLENVAWGPRDPFPNVTDYAAVLGELDPDRAGFTLDLGHARIAHLDTVQFVETLGDRIVNVHVHANDGQEDWHWALSRNRGSVAEGNGGGIADMGYEDVAAHLAARSFEGMIIHECAESPGFAAEFLVDWAGVARG